MTDRVSELHNSTTNTHQRAQDLLAFINNMTLDINSNSLHLHQGLLLWGAELLPERLRYTLVFAQTCC